jgi:hypothetical protein
MEQEYVTLDKIEILLTELLKIKEEVGALEIYKKIDVGAEQLTAMYAEMPTFLDRVDEAPAIPVSSSPYSSPAKRQYSQASGGGSGGGASFNSAKKLTN